MGITATFNKDDVRARLDAFVEMVKKKQIARLQQLGEMCLTEAREAKTYMMQTGALLSSTGFGVYVDGVAVHTQFDVASGAQSDAAEKGMQAGRELCDKVGRETKGVALVCVAGMNYAAYVEAKGYNVLASAERLAERELPRQLQRLVDNIKRVAE